MSWTDYESYVKVFASLGVITAFAAAVKYMWNRHRWRRFKRKCRNWQSHTRKSPIPHLGVLDDHDWMVLVEQMLVDSWFSPFEIETLLALAMSTAKGIVASTISVES